MIIAISILLTVLLILMFGNFEFHIKDKNKTVNIKFTGFIVDLKNSEKKKDDDDEYSY